MAEFTDEDRQILDLLRKSYEKSARTTSTRQPWQELFDREDSQNASRSVLAAQAVSGMAGSWPSMWSYGEGSTFFNTVTDSLDANVPASIRTKTSKLGQRGVPEIDFVPYNHRTNSFGNKGPSLLGHPISFEIVGPTLKSPACDWTWEATLASGVNGGDELLMTSRPDGGLATCSTILEAYNLPDFTIGDINEPNGGLYLLVTADGANPGSIVAGLTPMAADSSTVDTARYEIFRISSIDGSSIEIHPSKSFASFFDLPPASLRYVRSITIVQPYVTRLAAIPGSGLGPGREQSFFLISPERAASSDLYPPLDGGSVGDGTWAQGGFTAPGAPGTGNAAGTVSSWLGRSKLPIPRPILEGQGIVESDIGFVSPTAVGEWTIFSDSVEVADIGKIIHITDVRSSRVLENTEDDFAQGSPSACFGWFEVQNVTPAAPNEILLLRLPEPNPQTGVIYYGPGPYLQALTTEEATVSFTIHENIESLWLGAYDIDKVESSRLKNILDPKYVERYQKLTSDVVPGFPKLALGNSSGRPDKAIFETRSVPGIGIPDIVNPGSLLDLGFRMILFPAKRDPSGPIPDFDKPIFGRELIIDPSIEETQYLTYDYSAGSVTLSHPPPPVGSSVGDIVPDGVIVNTLRNPRGEVVLFAACVPFSMEESQKGTGDRITARQHGDTKHVDLFSEPIEAFIDTVNTAYFVSLPYFGPSAIAPFPVEIVLDRIWEGPQTGVIEIVAGGQDDFPSFGIWSFSETRIVLVGTKNVTALGGIASLPSVSDPSINLSTSDNRKIVLRREVFFGPRSENLAGVLENFRTDTTYGASARSSILRFENARQTRNVDGTSSIIIEPPNQLWQQWGSWNAANIATGGLPHLAADGVFAGPVYFENGAPIVSGVGILSGSPEGQLYDMEILPVGGNNKAVVTNDIQLSTQQRFRIVTKFSVTGNGIGTDAIYYIGLIGNPVAGILTPAFASPVDPTIYYIGLRLEGDIDDVGDLWRVVIQNPTIPTLREEVVSILSNTTYYFIIETEQDGRIPVSGDVPTRLKISLLDKDLNPQFSLVIPEGDPVLPSPVTSFNYFAGLEYIAGAARRSINPYMVTYVNRIDLPGPEFGL